MHKPVRTWRPSTTRSHSYTEIADAIRANSPQPTADARQLWRCIVFNLLITNVDDHLQNLGFLHVSNARWRARGVPSSATMSKIGQKPPPAFSRFAGG